MRALYETIFDEISDDNLTKSIVDEIKKWTQSIKKTSGTIKVDKMGQISLMISSGTIECPIPNAARFKYVKNGCMLNLLYPSEQDIKKFDAIIDKITALYIRVNSYFKTPAILNKAKQLIFTSLCGTLDLENISDINTLNIAADLNKNSTIINTFNVAPKEKLILYNVCCKDAFESMKKIGFITITNIKCEKDVFKNLQTATAGIFLHKCSDIDLSHMKHVNILTITLKDDQLLDTSLLPQSMDKFHLRAPFKIDKIDLNSLKNIKEFVFNDELIKLPS